MQWLWLQNLSYSVPEQRGNGNEHNRRPAPLSASCVAKTAQKALEDAKYHDEIFWRQAQTCEREGCSTLPASYFNRP
jgi:hypothetical protein